MRLPRNPSTRTRIGLAAAALAAGASMVLAAAPAHAAPEAPATPAGADLDFRIAGEDVVGLASKPFYLQVVNHGPATAENIVAKIDLSGIDRNRVDVEPPRDCTPNGTLYICAFGSLVAGETNSTFSPFTVTSVKPRDGDPKIVGPGGTFSIELTSDTPDPNPANNKKTDVPLKVVHHNTDLSVQVEDVWASKTPGETGGEPVAPGGTAPLVFFMVNHGTNWVRGLEYKVTLPDFVTFAPGEHAGCKFNEARTVATCTEKDVVLRTFKENVQEDSFVPEPLFQVTVAKDAPGPVSLAGGMVAGVGIEFTPEVSLAAVREAATKAKGGVVKVDPPAAGEQKIVEADPSDNFAPFAVHTGANPADLGITAGSGHGTVGATVTIPVTVTNAGPASSPNTTVTVTAPTGTELTAMPKGCVFETAGKLAKCGLPVKAGKQVVGQFSFKILATSVGSNGKAEVSGTLDDPVETNNSAAITITVDSGLPITGAKVSAVAGVGLAALLVGIGLFVAARRRRVVLVTPSEDR